VFGVVVSSGDKLSSPPVVGQFACNDVAKVGSMLSSLLILFLKNKHLAWPIVWAPIFFFLTNNQESKCMVNVMINDGGHEVKKSWSYQIYLFIFSFFFI
jgi:hypothetical protein